MIDEPKENAVEYNPDLAIATVKDMIDINPEGFTHVQIGDYDLYVENGPTLRERKDPAVVSTFGNDRFIGVEHLEPKFPGQPDLKVKRGAIFTISSQRSWDPIWDLDLTEEEYAVALIGATSSLKRDLHKGSREIITSLPPKGEIVKISYVPFDPNGTKNGHGVVVREMLEQRKAVLQKKV